MKKSPFVEKLTKRGFEVLYLPEAVDEYCIQALPEFKSARSPYRIFIATYCTVFVCIYVLYTR